MSMSWHAGGSDYLIRHIKRLGQTEQTGKERQARWGPSNCLRHTVGVCVSGWCCEKVCTRVVCMSESRLCRTACRNVSVSGTCVCLPCEHVWDVLWFSGGLEWKNLHKKKQINRLMIKYICESDEGFGPLKKIPACVRCYFLILKKKSCCAHNQKLAWHAYAAQGHKSCIQIIHLRVPIAKLK